jgi:hypothetical protein
MFSGCPNYPLKRALFNISKTWKTISESWHIEIGTNASVEYLYNSSNPEFCFSEFQLQVTIREYAIYLIYLKIVTAT